MLKDREYLIEDRLADILAMIQALALSRMTRRTESGLISDLGRKPRSSDSWIALGEKHSEFFRVSVPTGKQPNVALIARNVQEDDYLDYADDGVKPILAPDITIKLMERAADLHDRQAASSQAWRNWALPILVSVLALGGSIVSALITSYNKTQEPTTVVCTPTVPPASRAQIAPHIDPQK